MDHNSIQVNAIKALLDYIGENPNTEENLKVPFRVLESYKNIFAGYHQNLQEVIGEKFDIISNNDIILLKNLDFFSMCMHHMLPFYGSISVAYIPRDKVIGLGRIKDLIGAVTRKLQIQEKIGNEIVNVLMASALNPKGVIAKIDALHFCSFSKVGCLKPSSVSTIACAGETETLSLQAKLQIFSEI